MRTFTLGSGDDRRFVVIEVDGATLGVVQGRADGSTKRADKALPSEAAARSAAERMAAELSARGYVERTNDGTVKPTRAVAPKPEKPDRSHLYDDLDEPEVAAGPALPRVAATTAEAAPKKKKRKTAGRGKSPDPAAGDGLDRRVLAAAAGFGLLVAGGLMYFAYESFLKPPSLVGHWRGSQMDYQVSRSLSIAAYQLILGADGRASISEGGGEPDVGTYQVKGDRLKLTLRDGEGEATERDFKVVLGRMSLDLIDPGSGKRIVQLMRIQSESAIGKMATAAPATRAPAAPTIAEADPAADARLASVEFSPKDAASKLKHPPGWQVETGARPDNTYSWGRFTGGSAKIQVFADVQGSLMSGSDSAQPQEKGSPLAPVQRAHEDYKRKAAEEYTDYRETEPALFEGSGLGEGRFSLFTASAGGLFGGKTRGLRVTLLTNDRRVTLLCECPGKEFDALRPTLLAVCRSVAR